jgi:hypothetical protein
MNNFNFIVLYNEVDCLLDPSKVCLTVSFYNPNFTASFSFAKTGPGFTRGKL